MPITENNGAPVIPAGTRTQGVAYDPMHPTQGQGQPAPMATSPQQVQTTTEAPTGITFAELATKKGFQSPDDLAKAYESLESHNKKVEMTAADILKSVYPEPQPVAPVTPTQTLQPAGDDQAIKIVESMIDARTKPLQERIALQDLFLTNPDAKDYATGIAQAVKENPGISWQAAFKLAKYEAAQEQAKTAGRQEAYQTMQQKQQVIAGTPTPTQRGGPDVRSIIRDRSVPFSEVSKMVNEYLRSNPVS